MTPEPLGFDPELEGLLRELAADPRSQLLRRTRPRTPAGLLERPGPVRAARTGLTAAERHLVEVHRDELADVLRRACLMRFYSDPSKALYLNRSRDARHAIAYDTPEQWRARARDALADARRSPHPLEGLELLEACLREDTARPVSITDLARASLLLQPTDVAEAYVGLDLVLSGAYDKGQLVVRALIGTRPSRYVESCAHETLGLAAGLHLGDERAVTHYRDAAHAAEQRPQPLMSWLYFATRICDMTQAYEAARRLGAVGPVGDPVIDSFVKAHHEQDSGGAVRPSDKARGLANQMRDVVGPVARRVLDVF